MGESNGEWGDQPDDSTRARRDLWLGFQPLSEVTHPLFLNFLSERSLESADLSRVGARWDREAQAIVYFFSEGLKYRPLDGRNRWTEDGVEFTRPRIVSNSRGVSPPGVIVAEGETDAAALSRHAPSWDIAILPAGSKGLSANVAKSLSAYEVVLLGNDNDEAGNQGAEALLEMLPRGRRLCPPLEGQDWCAFLADHEGDFDPLEYSEKPARIWFTLGEYLAADLGTASERNWFENGILPIRGQLVLHAAMKSLKSVLMGEFARSLATGTPLADRYAYTARPMGEGAQVLVFHPGEYQSRMLAVLNGTPEDQRPSLLSNLRFFKLADNSLPRLRVDNNFFDFVRGVAEDAEAEILMFDPLQRMTAGANSDKSYEMDPILDAFGELQAAGFTIVYSHHNNKAGRNTPDPYSMTGTQRFGADADSICSLFTPKSSTFDNEELGQKERNFTFLLRNGYARGGSIRVSPDEVTPELMHIEFGDLVTDHSDPDQEEMY